MESSMEELALNGGSVSVPEDLRGFSHPLMLQALPPRLFDRVNVLDYNGGGLIDELECFWARRIGHAHGLATNSGTSAIHSMMYGLDLRPGDEVIVPAFTFFATATPLVHMGCVPIPVDCLADDGNIDPDAISAAISSRTRAVVVTHMWGKPCNMNAITAICESAEIALLEDASHAHGAEYRGIPIGKFGVASAWSFGARKLITGGQGGVMATSDRKIYERGILLGHYNRRGQRDITLPEYRPYAMSGTGLNLRMHPYAAALITEQLIAFDKVQSERAETANYMRSELAGLEGLHVPEVPEHIKHSWYAFTMRYDARLVGIDRQTFIDALHAEGATEVDAPGSTRPIDTLALFNERIPFGRAQPTDEAKRYYASLIKVPTWYGPYRMKYAAAHVYAIKKVHAASKAGSLGKRHVAV